MLPPLSSAAPETGRYCPHPGVICDPGHGRPATAGSLPEMPKRADPRTYRIGPLYDGFQLDLRFGPQVMGISLAPQIAALLAENTADGV